MASFLTLGIIVLLILQVYGRPSNFSANRLANYMAYDVPERAYMPHASDTDKNDDSSLGGFEDRFKNRLPGGHTNEEDEVYSQEVVRQMVATGDDDSMLEEKALPFKNSHENGHFSNENDDSSIEVYRTPFQNHQEAQANTDDDSRMGLAHANQNDDTVISEEHEFLANQRGKDRSYPADVLSKRARLQVPCIYCCNFIRCVANFAHVCHCHN